MVNTTRRQLLQLIGLAPVVSLLPRGRLCRVDLASGESVGKLCIYEGTPETSMTLLAEIEITEAPFSEARLEIAKLLTPGDVLLGDNDHGPVII